MRIIRHLVTAGLLLLPAIVVAQQYSAQNPPPASFTFAGPLSQASGSGGMDVQFKFALVIHTLAPDRIDIIDTDTGAILVSDNRLTLKESKLKIPTNPSLKIFEWEGRTKRELITKTSPAWLYEKTDTRSNLEAQLFKGDNLIFKWRQSATYSYAAKTLIFETIEYNKKLKENQ